MFIMSKNMWMVRAGREAFLIDDFKRKNLVAIGWNELGDISKVDSRDKIKELVKEKCGYTKKSAINIVAGQISRFLMDFKKGDYVVSYDPNARVYLVGEIEGEYEYNPELRDFHQTRKVKWLGEVGRDKLSTSTRNTLGAISTIFQVSEIAAREIIGILEGKQTAKDESLDEAEEESLKEDMVSRAHELIKDHLMKLEWEEMEQLVAGILEAMGFKTTISESGSDRGKDIEASPDGLMLKEPRILVEVKHRSGQMGSKDIRNFHSVLRGRKGLYVSTGGFTKEAKYEAERGTEQLTLIDADRLVELVVENYDSFDIDTKLLIPLSKIYWPT
jgi:restriction system protein